MGSVADIQAAGLDIDEFIEMGEGCPHQAQALEMSPGAHLSAIKERIGFCHRDLDLISHPNDLVI